MSDQQSSNQTSQAYGALLAVSGLLALAAIATLIPAPHASWPNILGYRSYCTFTPISTALLALAAGTTCFLRARFFGPKRGQKRSYLPVIIVAATMALVVALSIPPYVEAKSTVISSASQASDR